jgi:hypothetical protein
MGRGSTRSIGYLSALSAPNVHPKKKMPLIIFGGGLKNKDHVKFKGLRHGVSNKIYRQLKHREGLGESLLLNINEYKTSKVSKTMIIEHTF